MPIAEKEGKKKRAVIVKQLQGLSYHDAFNFLESIKEDLKHQAKVSVPKRLMKE